MAKLRVGVVGGGFGGYGLTPAFRLDARCEVVAISAGTIQSAQVAAERWKIPSAMAWQDMIMSTEIDVLAIATPPTFQANIASAALQSGKPVFAEKPLSATLDEAISLAHQAKESGLANMVDFIFPELETWRQAKLILERGDLGVLRHAFIDWRMESYDIRNSIRSWKTDVRGGGGALTHFGCHSLYYLEWLFGQITDLGAKLSTAPTLELSGDSLASLSFQCQNEMTGSMTLCSAALGGTGHRIEIYGESGMLILENRNSDPVKDFRLHVTSREALRPKLVLKELQREINPKQDSRVVPVARIAKRFIDWVLEGKKSAPTFGHGLRVQRLLEVATRSDAQFGKMLTVYNGA